LEKVTKNMDVKKEDTSEESRQNHIVYYRSLKKIIMDIEKEKLQESESAILEHLQQRIDAMSEDLKRIEKMFPGIEDQI
jgi:uncharacterized protein YicC (UPF0701 family)